MAQHSSGPLAPDTAGWWCWKPPRRMRDTMRLLKWLSHCAGVAIAATAATAILGGHGGGYHVADCPDVSAA